MAAPQSSKHLLLAGAGHAHLPALASTRRYVESGVAVTLVAPDRFWYSGMGPGVLAGLYGVEQDSIDVARIVERGGGRALLDRVERIDPDARQVELAGGERLSFDLLSLDTGSEVPLDAIAGAAGLAVPVKPVRHLAELRGRWLALHPQGEPHRVLIAGGGTAGCEAAANALALARDRGLTFAVTLVTGGRGLLPAHSPRAAALVGGFLRRQGVEIFSGHRLVRVQPSLAHLDDGTMLAFDSLLVASGIRPTLPTAGSRLATATDGALLVDDRLRSVSHPWVFGGGDCVSLDGHPLDRVGVHAVRQSRVLHHNLLAAATGGPLRRFRPRDRYMLILNLGDGTGVCLRGRLALRGRWCFWLKDWLDRKFVDQYRAG